jgi:adenylosuccinate synthase
MTHYNCITDCQFGSTGKGLFAGYLGFMTDPDVLVMAPSPNAGHTLVTPDLHLIHKMLPLGILSSKLRYVLLGPGSLINVDRLVQELDTLRQQHLLEDVVVGIHQNAAMVLDEHRVAESDGGTAPGSTRQGTGAAQVARILRRPYGRHMFHHLSIDHPLFTEYGVQILNTASYQRVLQQASLVQVEGCQGYSLSVYHGEYPYVTCRDVTTASLMADCGIPAGCDHTVYGTFRTYPIRVANRPESGEYSGPTYGDSEEISFSSIGQQQELTTVTKLPRRIFTWSQLQAKEACIQNGVDAAFLNFCNYAPTWEELSDIWQRLSSLTKVTYVGFGPMLGDVYQIGSPAVAAKHLRNLWEEHH